MQVQVGKLSILTSYCLRFSIGPKMIIYNFPCLGKITFVGGKMFAKRTRPTFHLFCCWVKILNIKAWQIFSHFKFLASYLHSLVYWQEEMHHHRRDFWGDTLVSRKGKNQLLAMSSPHLGWNMFPSYTCHNEGRTGLPIVYFLLEPST